MEQVVTPLPTHSGQQSNRASMTAAQATGQHRNFNARFKTYLTRNLAYLYRLVTTVEGPLSEDLRHQVTHTLTYGLAVDANWPVARDLLLATASDIVPGTRIRGALSAGMMQVTSKPAPGQSHGAGRKSGVDTECNQNGAL